MQNQKTMAGSENEHTNSSSSSSSSEEEETQKTSQKQTLTPTSSSSDDSDSDHGNTPAIAPVKEVKKPMSKNQSALPAVGKRPAAEIDRNVKKRAKRETVIAVEARDSVNAVGFGKKKDPKLLFARLWSEDNEVELIQGMLNYHDQAKKDPIAEFNDFYEFVKDHVHVEVTSIQMLNKVKRLRKKYEINRAKFEKSGKVRTFSNQHEKRMYDLSHNLWNTNVPKKSKKSCLVSGYKLGSMGLMVTDEGIMSNGLKLLKGTKKAEMEEKWKALKVQELEHFVSKVELLKEQAEVVLDAVKRSGAN